jgi:broad specificity polyphosphatase/5'/3'-nucleotidase SurE
MTNRFIALTLASVGLLSISARAQMIPSTIKAQTVRDSVFAQAAAVRMASSDNVSKFKSNFFAIRGLRTVTKSYKLLNANIPVLSKKHVIKHKTTGALVEKVTYYNSGQKQLQEQYQNGQLINFTLLQGYERGQPAQTIQFVKGDYISITHGRIHAFPAKPERPRREFYHYPAPPVTR